MLATNKAIEQHIKTAVTEVIQPYADSQVAHEASCLEYRKGTQKKLKSIKKSTQKELEGIRQVLQAGITERQQQHMENLKSLVYQRALLITIVLAMIGFISSQAFTRLFAQNAQTTTSETHSTSTRSK